MPLVINIQFYCMYNKLLLVEETIHILYIYRSFYFFDLNPYFLANSKLITSSITLLSNNVFTVTLSCISILLSLIFTITSLNIFLLQQDVFSITLVSVVNLLYLIKPGQELLNSFSHLNYSHCLNCFHILASFLIS